MKTVLTISCSDKLCNLHVYLHYMICPLAYSLCKPGISPRGKTYLVNNKSIFPLFPASLLVLPGENPCPLQMDLQIPLGAPIFLPEHPMTWGACTFTSPGTVLVLQTAWRSWRRQSIVHLTWVGKRNWGFPKPFGKCEVESLWESGNGREDRVLVHGAGRVSLPGVHLGARIVLRDSCHYLLKWKCRSSELTHRQTDTVRLRLHGGGN